MSESTLPHQGCSCSRKRKCAFHQAQIKRMEKVAKPLHDAKKVSVGIEELRARYAKPPKTPTPAQLLAPSAGPRTGRNGWDNGRRR